MLSNELLIKLLEHPNEWQRRMAQRLLSGRGANVGMEGRLETQPSRLPPPLPEGRGRIAGSASETVGELHRLIFMGREAETRLAALWAARSWKGNSAKAKGDWLELLATCFNSDHPELRILAVRFATDELQVLQKQAVRTDEGSERIVTALERLASDPDPSVRLAVAIGARQLVFSSLTINTDINTEAPIGKILAALIKSSADAKDPLLPFMIWMAGEPIVAANPHGGLDWLAEHGAETLPLSGILARKAMRRICDTQDTAKLDVAGNFLSEISGKSAALTLAAIEGLIEGQQAKPMPPARIRSRYLQSS